MDSLARDELLAEIASLFYEDGLTQHMIAERTGIGRTTISRMLAEAREVGLVEIVVHQPDRHDESLAALLVDRYPTLEQAIVVRTPSQTDRLRGALGRAGAQLLDELLHDDVIVGLTWGSSIAAIGDALEPRPLDAVTVIQLAGAVAAEDNQPRGVMSTFVDKLEARTVELHAPFLVESAPMAAALRRDPTNRRAIEYCELLDIAIVGIGAVDAAASTLVAWGHVTSRDIEQLRSLGAIGDVAGIPIDAEGRPIEGDYTKRMVSISRSALLDTPVRLGIGGSSHKAAAIHAALVGGYITHLVTDSSVATVLGAD